MADALSAEELEALRLRWQPVFERLPVVPGAFDVSRSLFIVNVDTPRPVPIGGVRFKSPDAAVDVCRAYADALGDAGFVVDASHLPASDDVRPEGVWYEVKFDGFGLPWSYGVKVESAGCRVTAGPDAVDAPGAPPIGDPPSV